MKDLFLLEVAANEKIGYTAEQLLWCEGKRELYLALFY
jgi:hypothetical protein